MPTNQMKAVPMRALPPKIEYFTAEWRGWVHKVPVVERWEAPLACKQPEACTCGVQKGNMAEVEKVAALFTLIPR